MRAVGKADRTGGAADLFHGDDVLEVAETEAAVFLRHGHAEQAHLAHFGPELAREAVAAINLVGQRRDAAQGELPDRLAQLVDARTQVEIEIDREHAASGRRARLDSRIILSDNQTGKYLPGQGDPCSNRSPMHRPT